MAKLFEVLVPTKYGDTLKPISTKHHKNWDAVVRKISGGLTIFKPSKGQWVYDNDLSEERIIPVRVMCSENQIKQIITFTIKHYRQKAVMYITLSLRIVG